MRFIGGMFVALMFLAAPIRSGGASAAAAASPPPTQEQAADLLDTLNDPAKRAQLTSLLETYVKMQPAAQGAVAPAAVVPATKAHRVASGTLRRIFARVADAETRFLADFRSITDASAIGGWLERDLTDADERRAFALGAGMVTLVTLFTAGVEWLLRRLMRRWTKTLRRGGVCVAAIVGAAVAGNLAILAVADLPVARLVALGVVNAYVALRFLFTLAPSLSAWSKGLWIAFVGFATLQLLIADIADSLGASDAIQGALEKCVALLTHGLGIALVLASRRSVADWIRRHDRRGTYWSVLLDSAAAVWPFVAIAAIAGSWLLRAMDIPDAYERTVRVIVTTVAVLTASRYFGNWLLQRIDARINGYASAPAATFGARLSNYRHSLRWTLQSLLIVATLLALTEAWGLDSVSWFSAGHPGHRVAAFLIQLLVLAVVGAICWEAADLAFERRVSMLMGSASLSRATRLRTLQPIVRVALLIAIALVVVVTALDAIGVNVGPLLAGASIVGVALGFGSQKLVQDFITGIFLLVEDAVDVGDWVTVGGLSGTVEHLSIRIIRLRAGDGSLHLIPFSSVTSVTNTNRGIGNAAVTVNVAPTEDTDRVCAILTDIAAEMRKDPQFESSMQSDLQLWGVDKVDGQMVTLAGQIVCTDAGRWAVQREFNRRMKMRFEREGVALAVPLQGLRVSGVPLLVSPVQRAPAS